MRALVCDESRMPTSRALIALLLWGAGAHAQEIEPLIDRPITLPRGALELTLHGAYSNWGTGSSLGGGPGSLTGETLALGLDYGATDQAQLGLGVALPINPGAGFGSILGSAAFAVDRRVALRVDAGFENIGVNGDNSGPFRHTSRFFAGLGTRIKVPLSPTVAFVSGRTGTVHFGHFNNLGDSGTGLYIGSSFFTDASSDLFVFSSGNNNSSNNIGINLPFGLLLQADPRLAVTLLAGYSAAISMPDSGSPVALHFLPVGLEAVFTPAPPLDMGLRFFFDGYFAQSGGSSSGNPGYFDLRALMLFGSACTPDGRFRRPGLYGPGFGGSQSSMRLPSGSMIQANFP
jgi:hypothetical protein